MNLADITHIEILIEGHIEPSALLSLQRVAASGRFTNKFEELVLAKFSALIKAGMFWNEADPVFTNAVVVSTAMLSALRSLQPEELQIFASHILSIAQQKNLAPEFCAPLMCATDWMRLYTAREATD